MTTSRLSLRALGVLATTLSATVALTTSADAGTGWFAAPVTSSLDNGAGPGPAPRGTATGDVDGDGNADLITIGDFTLGDLLVARGLGDGRFAPATAIAGTSGTQGLDVGDVDGDGDPDVVAMTTTRLTVLRNDGAGSFTPAGSYPLTLGGQVQPLLADLDSDGDLDVVAPTFTAIQTLLNNGSGTYSAGPATQVLGASVISAITTADLDGDALPDLFAVDGFSGTTFALRGKTGARFTVTGRLHGTAFVPEDVAALDLDGDGFDDAATIGSFSFSIATGLTNGHGAFRSVVPAVTQYSGPGPTSATVGDFDEDGREDLVVSSLANPAAGTLTVLAGNGTARMREVGTEQTAAFPQNPVPADYDDDAHLDLAVVSPGSVTTLLGTP